MSPEAILEKGQPRNTRMFVIGQVKTSVVKICTCSNVVDLDQVRNSTLTEIVQMLVF